MSIQDEVDDHATYEKTVVRNGMAEQS